ncbi:glycoside hydrolase family 43 protein [Aquipuribacter sp. MA13-6]|uniref:glycoside hydrolase family 43 protein n=1 Tax=unclassified Aquipuribacter TaxID=2635084 RepID=UPI003EEF630A
MRRSPLAPTVLAGLLVTSACGGAPNPDDEQSGAATSAAAAGPTGDEDSPDGDDGPDVGTAVIADDFPDPDVLEVDGTYYAYATNHGRTNVRVATSTDLVEWDLLQGDALPTLPSWVVPGKTWAPEVTRRADGTFVMWATATSFSASLQCIAVATSQDPLGPFEVQGGGMLLCPEDTGGAIDASTFVDDDGTTYLLWKNDGNCCGFDTWLYAAPLAEDLLSLAGDPVPLLRQDLAWEGDLVEAPTLIEREGRYVLLYSANGYYGEQYATGYATADAVAGPWTKHPEPLLSTDLADGELIGPGGQDVVVAPDGSDVLVFHSWDDAITYRGMHVAPLDWVDGEPVVRLD